MEKFVVFSILLRTRMVPSEVSFIITLIKCYLRLPIVCCTFCGNF